MAETVLNFVILLVVVGFAVYESSSGNIAMTAYACTLLGLYSLLWKLDRIEKHIKRVCELLEGGGMMERTEDRRELPVYAVRLRELRRARGVSSRRVSEYCGMSHGMVGFYESGMKEPKASALITLADFYGVSVDYILGLEPE